MKLWVLVAFIAGCGATVSRSIKREWLGGHRAKLATYMKSFDQTEGTEGGIRHDVVRDEATLVKLQDGEACFVVVLRTAAEFDEPIDQLSPECADSEALLTEEASVSVVDYPYEGEREVFRVDAVAASKFLGLSLKEPAERVFRVIERRGQLCCEARPGGKVALSFTSRRMQYNNTSFGQTFQWDVADR